MWTKWFDVDDAEDAGDFETLLKIQRTCPESVCQEPISIQARVVGSDTLISALDFYQRIEMSPKVGLICKNVGQSCQNFEVRFCCPEGKMLFIAFVSSMQAVRDRLQHLDVLRGRLLGSHVNFHWQLGGQNNHQPCSSNDISHCSSSQFKHRAGQRCFELLALIGSPQLSFQRYSQLNKHLGLTGKPYWLAERQMVSRE